MKHLIKLFCVQVLLLLPFALHAQVQTTTAGANIVAPLTLTETSDMHFGTLSVDNSPGTVVLTPNNVRTSTGGVLLSSVTPMHRVAAYSVTGQGTLSYVITLPTSVTIQQGPNSMVVNNFTTNKAGNTGALNAGVDSFNLGATLQVSASKLRASIQAHLMLLYLIIKKMLYLFKCYKSNISFQSFKNISYW
jgi:hypothetical protein